MSKRLLVSSIAVAAAFVAGGASAATTYFFPSALNAPTSPFSVTAGYVSPSGTGAATVSTHPHGLGVQSPWETPGSTGAVTIDGNPLLTAEFLTISFDYAVKLDSFQLGTFDRDDEYTLVVETTSGSQVIAGNTAYNPLNVNYVTGFTIFAEGTTGIDGPRTGYDDFRLENIRISAVPLPAGAGLLLGALGLMGLARRRRGAQA